MNSNDTVPEKGGRWSTPNPMILLGVAVLAIFYSFVVVIVRKWIHDLTNYSKFLPPCFLASLILTPFAVWFDGGSENVSSQAILGACAMTAATLYAGTLLLMRVSEEMSRQKFSFNRSTGICLLLLGTPWLKDLGEMALGVISSVDPSMLLRSNSMEEERNEDDVFWDK